MPERASQPSRWFLPALLLVSVLGAAVRILAAATEPPHFDESYTAVQYVLGDVGSFLTTYDEPNNHLFHSLLAWATTSLLGDGALALRLPALLAGIALVPATGLLARAVVRHARGAGRGGAAAGLVAAAIVAAAPPLVAYSANARGYAIVLLLMVLQLRLTLALARGSEVGATRPVAAAVGWVVCGALATWTIPTAAIAVAGAALWWAALGAVSGQRVRALGRPTAALAATAALSLALYAPVLGQRGFSVDRFEAAPTRQLVTTLLHAWGAGAAAPLIAAMVLLAAIGSARRPRLGPRAPILVVAAALPVAMVVLGRVLPYSRTYLFLLPLLAVMAGVGAARIVERRRASARVGAAIVGGLAVIVVLAGATAQTREAWAEDPPGPPVADLRRVALEALTRDPRIQLVAPGFDAPQVQYALAGVGDLASVDVRRPAQPGRAVAVLTRRGVPPEVAVAGAPLSPGEGRAFGQTLRCGDAVAYVLAPAPPAGDPPGTP